VSLMEDESAVLALPPQTDDLAVALAARPARPKLPKVTLALSAAVLICAGFIGGVLVQKHDGKSTGGTGAASAFTGAASRFGRGGTSGTGGFGAAGGTGGGAAGGAVTGTVTVVNGNTVYVTAADGSVYTVTTSGSTTVSIAQSGSVAQLKPGQSVVITGTTGSNGDVTAKSITAGSGTSTSSGSN
jgi:hypothetical protein